MSWLFMIFLLSATFFSNLAEGIHDHKKLPSAVVVGTVYCDTCFQHDSFESSHFITGATVAVECSSGDSSRPSFRQEAKTNEHGEFKVALPFPVSKHVRKIKRCSVTLLISSEPFCAVSSRAVSSSLHLKSRNQGEHVFSAGVFSFKPENQPEICYQRPRTTNSNLQLGSEKSLEPSVPPVGDDPSFPPPLEDPPVSGYQFHLPPLPVLPRLPPLPQLPPLPPLPGLPLLPPLPEKAAKGRKLDSETSRSRPSSQFPAKREVKNPDFFFPITPPVLPPNPFQPPPLFPPVLPQPPPMIPPVLPQPPPSPLIPTLPPFPGLTPPPSPPPPSLPVPFPPLLPVPPPSAPRFPGIPPASSSTSSKKPSP